MDKAALYLRLSKEDVDKINKGDDSESIINQRLLLTDFAIEHEFQIVGIYSDDDYSGLYNDRPDFDRLIRDAKIGMFNVVIAKSQARFTRNMEHLEKYLHHDFPLLGIRFLGVVDGADTQDQTNKKNRQINGLVNEWYCEDLSNNIRAVFKQKMKAGQFLGSFAPYGYLKDPEDRHQFVVDEYAADVIRRIYRLFLEGYTDRHICHILEDENIPNPTIYKKMLGLNYANKKSEEFGAKYGLWSTTTIKRILTNETYLGKLMQGTAKKVSYKDKKVVAVPKEEWIVIENHHEAIIDEETFQQVARMRERRRICADNQGKDKKVHIFAGKLRCSTCGHTMIKSGGVRGRKDDWYLRCQLANKSRCKECTSHNIRFSIVQDVVQERIRSFADAVLKNPDCLDKIEKMLEKDDVNDSLKKERKKFKELEIRADGITKSMQTMYIDRVQGNITDDMFYQLKVKCEDELQEIKIKKTEQLKKIEQLEAEVNNKNDIREIVNKYTDYSILTHEIVNDFVEYIEIGEKNKDTDEQEIKIYWNF